MPSASAPAKSSLYTGLLPTEVAPFPKTCSKCGIDYISFEDYLTRTFALSQGSGLAAYNIEVNRPQVGLFRACICGKIMLTFCSDRRDLSPAGAKRRQIFGDMLNKLVDTGMSALEARQHLLAANNNL